VRLTISEIFLPTPADESVAELTKLSFVVYETLEQMRGFFGNSETRRPLTEYEKLLCCIKVPDGWYMHPGSLHQSITLIHVDGKRITFDESTMGTASTTVSFSQ
jgi:hypothetical protein